MKPVCIAASVLLATSTAFAQRPERNSENTPKLADPQSRDPIEHFSTRLSCALALNMQSTYDPRVIKDIIPGNAFNDRALKPFYSGFRI
jgi:hypothetical protein